MKYLRAEIIGEGLARVLAGSDTQLWSLSRLRKVFDCVVCKKLMHKGELSYRPIGSPSNRYQRICMNCIERLAKYER